MQRKRKMVISIKDKGDIELAACGQWQSRVIEGVGWLISNFFDF